VLHFLRDRAVDVHFFAALFISRSSATLRVMLALLTVFICVITIVIAVLCVICALAVARVGAFDIEALFFAGEDARATAKADKERVVSHGGNTWLLIMPYRFESSPS